MRICFLVLAHHQPGVFRRLVRNLSSPSTDIVVHIDRKSNTQDFRTDDLYMINYLENRRNVYWTGWSQTRAICNMLEHGLQISDADYFIFLAGTDFPIKGLQKLIDHMKEIYPTNLLNWYPLVPGIWGYQLIGRYHFRSLAAPLIDSRNIWEPQGSLLRRVNSRLVLRAEQLVNRYTGPRDTRWTRFYHGSSRWCLNRHTVEFLLKYYESRKSRSLRTYLRLATNSDEIFVQTAILNSSFAEQCAGFDPEAAAAIFAGEQAPMPDEVRVYLHYIDWSPEREDPAIMVESDFDALRLSDKYFACKFLDGKSDKLLDRVESELL